MLSAKANAFINVAADAQKKYGTGTALSKMK